MKIAVSNIALPSYNHIKELYELREMGFRGLEVAPSKVWDNVKNVTPKQVSTYRKQVEKSGLKVIGIHSLFFDQPDLGLFRGFDIRKNTIKFLIHLSNICSDLGGKFLVFGSPQARKRESLSIKSADVKAISFFSELSNHIENHGTYVVIEALGKTETDYITSLKHAYKIINKVNRPELQGHLDAKAVFDASEAKLEIFNKIKSKLQHVHINHPGLGMLRNNGKVDHKLLSSLLKDIGYNKFLSLEQRMLDLEYPIAPLKKSYRIIKSYYNYG
jgi:sugar phosphate isomerase/epimerase